MNHFEVIIIGSGFAGICAAIKLKNKGIHNFVILERENEIGGTWWRNNYPGAAVDVISTLYSFSFEHYNWSRLYAKQAEILSYTNHIIDKHGLRENARVRADVSLAEYDEESHEWQVSTQSGDTYKAPILINAIGHLSQPSIPNIPGKASFNGESFHTSRWNHEFDYTGKKVGVIGTGASGIQVIPPLSEQTDELHVFQRTAQWIMPRHDKEVSSLTKRLQAFPLYNRVKRALTYAKLETRVVAFQYLPVLIRLIAEREATHHMKEQIKDTSLLAKLKPDYTIGCKRILISDQYYPALQQPNVQLQTQGIKEINERGIELTTGEQIDLDMIVYATGFHAFSSNDCLPFDIIGPKGVSLKEQWANKPQAYAGVSVAGFPNLFNINGPNTGIGHTSAIFMTESQVNYIISAIDHMTQHNLAEVSIKPEEEAQYNQRLQRAFKHSVWSTGGCESWYQGATGENTTIFPTFTFLFYRRTRTFTPSKHVLVNKT